MTEIATRYRLARQRVGQIITAWRTRAVMEGYVQNIELESPQVPPSRLHSSDSAGEVCAPFFALDANPIASSTQEPIEQFPSHLSTRTERSALVDRSNSTPLALSSAGSGGPNLVEKLQAIIGVLHNQLSLCSQPRFVGNRQSCDQLLMRAKELCSRLEFYLAMTPSVTIRLEQGYDAGQTETILARAREFVGRFPEAMQGRPVLVLKSPLKKARKSTGVRLLVSSATGQNGSQAVSQRIALGS